ncbi:MAG: response regulator, partial [Gammaproteobacteria bacterium]|nr:response regulator [Gammaproteobacteria bacterium]
AGTSATSGYNDISKHAKSSEHFLKLIDPVQLNLALLTDKLEAYISAIQLDMEDNEQEQAIRQHEEQLATHTSLNQPSQNITIYIADDDQDLLDELVILLNNAGYQASGYLSPESLQAQMNHSLPSLLILDIVFANDEFAGINFVNQIQEQYNLELPVIFLSVRDDFEHRMQASKTSGSYYLPKPVDVSRLLHSIELVINKNFTAPNRVLIVDDDPDSAEYTSTILLQNGMQTRIINSPLQCLDAINEFQPNVIVMDVYMPQYSGIELARVIRMDPLHQFTSIIFLSSETNQDRQLDAIALGGDDFLTKPVSSELLVRTIHTRALRSSSIARAYNQLSATVNELERFKLTLDQHAIVSVADTHGNITYANNKFCQISGYPLNELIGQNHRLLNSGHHPADYFQDMWQTIRSGKTWQGEIKNRAKNGSYYWVASTITPILDKYGQPIQYISIRTDISRQKLIENQIRDKEERLRRSQQYANIGTWDWNISTGDLYWSERIGPLFGYDKLVDTTYENFINAVHPDDRDFVTESVTACVKHGATYDIEHRIIRTDGKVRWLSEKGDVVRDENGSPLHMLGVVQDITRRKTAEKLLDLLNQSTSVAISSEEYAMVFEQMLEGLLDITDSEYGFIGEVLHHKNGEPYLKTHSITNISWNDETKQFYEQNAPDGLEFTNLNSLFGEVLKTGKVVISNSPKDDPRSGGLPDGHPDLNAFLGVPLYYGNQMLGMYGIANRSQGYSDNIVDFLQPFNATCGSLMHGLWVNREREEDHQHLKIAKEEAEQANQAKSEFLSRMSHELRTPMNAILGFAQLMESDPNDPLSDGQEVSVVQILKAGWHLLELINEVLDLAKIESGNMDISLEQIDAKSIMQECIDLVEPQADQTHISIETPGLDTHEQLLISADRTRFKQVYLNLLSNAIKYNKNSGKVLLSIEPYDDHIDFIIKDTGRGIAAEQLDKIFEPFNRLGAENTEVEGTGIGLVIAKSLVELMGGSIRVESQLDIGTTFFVTMPDAFNQLNPIQDDVMTDDIELNPSTSEDRDFTIVYVEDNPANMKLVQKMLARIPNIKLIVEYTGKDGLKSIIENQPDLALLDINIPDMSGMDIAKVISQQDKTAHIPLIAISANAMQSDIDKAMNAGFKHYLTKPLDMQRFMDVINSYLHNTN